MMSNKSDIRVQVEEFMVAAGQFVGDTPKVPDDKVVRLRAKILAEETFEFLEASFGNVFSDVKKAVNKIIDESSVDVDIVEIADALGDIDYVSEGARCAYGINGKPIAESIHKSNMDKFGPGHSFREDGKLIKPSDWKAPDILGELVKQGYVGK